MDVSISFKPLCLKAGQRRDSAVDLHKEKRQRPRLLSRGEQGRQGGKRGKQIVSERGGERSEGENLAESEVTARGFITRGQEPATGKKQYMDSLNIDTNL